MKSFNGNAERFYPRFYDAVSGDEIVFPKLNRKCAVFLGFEVANTLYWLTYLMDQFCLMYHLFYLVKIFYHKN